MKIIVYEENEFFFGYWKEYLSPVYVDSFFFFAFSFAMENMLQRQLELFVRFMAKVRKFSSSEKYVAGATGIVCEIYTENEDVFVILNT